LIFDYNSDNLTHKMYITFHRIPINQIYLVDVNRNLDYQSYNLFGKNKLYSHRFF